LSVQLAEVARRKALAESTVSPANELPMVFIMLGTRDAPAQSAAGYVLSGRLHLEDFTSDCKVTEPQTPKKTKDERAKAPQKLDGKFHCEEMKHRPEMMFDVLPKKSKSNLGIYMLQRDLPYAWTCDRETGAYSSGTASFENGGGQANLAWVE